LRRDGAANRERWGEREGGGANEREGGGRTGWVGRVCRRIEDSKGHGRREPRGRRNERGEAGNGVGFENKKRGRGDVPGTIDSQTSSRRGQHPVEVRLKKTWTRRGRERRRRTRERAVRRLREMARRTRERVAAANEREGGRANGVGGQSL
jgi:hypothetical protein